MGRLHALHRGVYAVGHTALSPHARYLAAALAVGEDAAVGGWAAAHLHGLTDRAPQVPDVVTPRQVRPRRGMRVRQVARLEATRVAGVPVTTPAATILALAGLRATTEPQLRRLVRQAQIGRLLTHAALLGAARAGGGSGARRVASLLGAAPAAGRSEAEALMLALVARHGFPRHLANARIAGEEADLWFPELGLIVEVDSRGFHDVSSVALDDDRRKQARWEAVGQQVLRVTYAQLIADEATTVRRLRLAVEARQASAAAASACSS